MYSPNICNTTIFTFFDFDTVGFDILASFQVAQILGDGGKGGVDSIFRKPGILTNFVYSF